MRELDFLFERYLEQHYPDAAPEERAGFYAILELPDPVILSWVTGREEPPAGSMREIVGKLLQQPGS
jgi:succinate dehydrogenase flavin-adding protein (antitoxin of CptAB toxin-antitoxin module)